MDQIVLLFHWLLLVFLAKNLLDFMNEILFVYVYILILNILKSKLCLRHYKIILKVLQFLLVSIFLYLLVILSYLGIKVKFFIKLVITRKVFLLNTYS